MKRRIAAAVAAGVLALTLAQPAGAATKQVKGKFKPDEYPSDVRGSGRARPTEDGAPGEWRVGLRLQKVYRDDYLVYVGTYIDANANKLVEESEKQGFALAGDCDLSNLSGKGHAGCVDEVVALTGRPYRIELRYVDGTGEHTDAFANLKG